MNLSEFNTKFDYSYNNSFNFGAPPINMLEKSICLTEAQEDIVKQLYDNFDKDERSREQLRNLTVNKVIDYDSSLNSTLVGHRFNQNSKFFELPSEVWYVLAEKINSEISVIPIPIDEYNVNIRNPFKHPKAGLRAWRLDVVNTVDATKNIREIVYPEAISNYTIRYIKKPTPIILEDLTLFKDPLGNQITIDGLYESTPCKLSDSLHMNIIELAVQKAKLTLEENNISNRIQSGIVTSRDK